MIAATAGVALTTVAGSVVVVAAYVPLRDAPPAAQWLLVFVLMAGESAAIHLPSEIILPIGGWQLVRDHHLGLAGIAALSMVAAAGNTLGSLALYSVGRTGGRGFVRRYGRYILLHEDDVVAAERRMERHHVWALLASRVLPVVRTYSGFAAGMLRVPIATFVAATFVGSFVWAIAFITIGDALGANWRAIRTPAEVIAVIALLTLVAALLAATVVQLRRSSQL
jgi:membrane protein DedA with SNARE-associated domain